MWEGKECENKEDQEDALDLVRKEIEPYHVNFIVNNNEINDYLKPLGRKWRINRLMSTTNMLYNTNGTFTFYGTTYLFGYLPPSFSFHFSTKTLIGHNGCKYVVIFKAKTKNDKVW